MGIKDKAAACNCKDNERKEEKQRVPLKMKVLKKIKRRMGLASRSSSNGSGTNNLPPLLFHSVHGENIRISRDGTVAKRVESFCKGIAFSSRPVKINEKVCIKFLEISNNWSGVIRFGFTSNDPTSLRYGLPKYACPDLTNKPGYWAKALPERLCSQGTVLFYYVTLAGDVHFGINGEEKGVFFGSVETRGPLWCLIDVYGNSTAIEFVDQRHQLNNSSSRQGCESTNRPDPVDRITYPMQQMTIHQQHHQQQQQQHEEAVASSFPVLRYQSSGLSFQAMPLHRTRGRNVRFLTMNRSIAYRTDTEFCQGYVFTSRPLQIGERIVTQILGTEPMFQGCLGLGLTSCDPSTLTQADLPDDSNFLLDRPEYWVLSRDFARNLNKGDEIGFCISQSGEVQISRNGGAPLVIIHVDQTLRLWAFFDVYGSTQKIRVLSGVGSVSPTRNASNAERRIVTPTATESMNSINSQAEIRRNTAMQQSNSRLCCVAPADIQVQPSANGGTVLSVILPPAHANIIASPAAPVAHIAPSNSHPGQHITYAGHSTQIPSAVSPVSSPTTIIAPVQTSGHGTGTMISTCSSNYVEPITDSSAYSTPLSWSDQSGGNNGAGPGVGVECTICYEHPIDAVLYMCGHMCMCYECALQQWRGKGGGHCPLCRAVIRDVIRTYKS